VHIPHKNKDANTFPSLSFFLPLALIAFFLLFFGGKKKREIEREREGGRGGPWRCPSFLDFFSDVLREFYRKDGKIERGEIGKVRVEYKVQPFSHPDMHTNGLRLVSLLLSFVTLSNLSRKMYLTTSQKKPLGILDIRIFVLTHVRTRQNNKRKVNFKTEFCHCNSSRFSCLTPVAVAA
jgi:hypothetical protein